MNHTAPRAHPAAAPGPALPAGDCFILHGQVRLAELADLYALDLVECRERHDLTLSDVICRQRAQPRQGDRVRVGPLELEVMHAGAGAVARAGLRFRSRASPGLHAKGDLRAAAGGPHRHRRNRVRPGDSGSGDSGPGDSRSGAGEVHRATGSPGLLDGTAR